MSSICRKIFVGMHSFLFAKNMDRYRIIIGAMLLGVCQSTPWFYGNLFTYEYSYFKYRLGEGQDVYAEVVWIFPVYFVLAMAAMLSVDSLQRLTSLRITLIISIILENVGMFLSYFAVQLSVWTTMITFSLIFGIGQGIKLALGYLYASKWHGNNVGLSTGFVMSGNGLGGIAFNVIITSFMNPENLKPTSTDGNLSFFMDRHINERFPTLYLILGGLAACFHLAALVFIEVLSDTSKPVEEKLMLNEATKGVGVSGSRSGYDYKSMQDTGEPTSHIIERKSDNSTSSKKEVHDGRKVIHKRVNALTALNEPPEELRKLDRKPRDVLKSIQFYTIWFAMFAMGLSFLTISNSYKLISQLIIHDDNFLAFIGSTNCIAVIFCRLGIGLFIDRYGVFNGAIALLSTNSVCLSFWFFAVQPSRWLFLVWTSFLIGIQSSLFNVFPVALLKSFGPTYYVTNTAILMSSLILSSLVLPPLMSYFETVVGWLWFFQFVSAIGVTSLLSFIIEQLLHTTSVSN